MSKTRKSATKNFNQYGIVIGETYGNYKVLEKIKVKTKVSRGNGKHVFCMATKWKCLYLPTNEEKIVPTGYLCEFKPKTIELEELDNLVKANKHQIGFRNNLYRYYKTNSKKRGHEFLLSKEEFENLIFQNCFYCGEPPKPMTESQMKGHGNTKQPPLYYNGIDRLNNNLDYTVDNCVPCCSKCNYMKHTENIEDFIQRIKTIYTNLNLGSTTIENILINSRSEQSTSQANGDGNGRHLVKDEDIV